MKTINRAGLFLIITFAVSYGTAAVYYFVNGGRGSLLGFTLMAAAYMFIPLISVLMVKKVHKERLFSDLLISFKINRWFFAAWLIFPLAVFGTLCVSLLLPNITYNPEMTGMFGSHVSASAEEIETFKNQIAALPVSYIWIGLIQGLIAGITINAAAAFGEEAGWRGFLLREFKEMPFFKAALIIGIIWGVWHAPLILMGHNYPQHPQIGVLMMTVFCILLTPIIQYVTIKAKSVIAAAIAHGTLNALAGFSIMLVSGGNDLTTGLPGLPGFIVLLIVNGAIFVYDSYISKGKIMTNKMSGCF